MNVHVLVTVQCGLLSQCLSGDIAVFNQFPMHFNGDNSCAKLGSKWSNENGRFAGHSGVSIFRGNACDWSCVAS